MAYLSIVFRWAERGGFLLIRFQACEGMKPFRYSEWEYWNLPRYLNICDRGSFASCLLISRLGNHMLSLRLAAI